MGPRRYLREGPQSLRRSASPGIHRHLQSLPDARLHGPTAVCIPPQNPSTDDAIAHLLHTTLTHLDEGRGNYVKMLFVDYSSAFNTIIPSLLTTKLGDLGLHTSLCDWISNFLTDRPQSVRVGNCASSTLTLSTGAPQGCVLSPLLYSLYTYDCTATSSSNTIVKFADDTVVVGLISDNDERAYLEEIKKPGKRQFSKRQTCPGPPHTSSLAKKARQRLYHLRRLRDFRLPSKVLRNFFTCTIESILTGKNHSLWGEGPSTSAFPKHTYLAGWGEGPSTSAFPKHTYLAGWGEGPSTSAFPKHTYLAGWGEGPSTSAFPKHTYLAGHSPQAVCNPGPKMADG
ncbi:hypothetical protein P4O66_019969 [Electrophorus voltai]|uniref:Reverse transcriptase domain-containing protein n=1 Tax=Electrophorus voltai TaxID=2609070 RepID=A0AAD8YNN0_9TELE|nr:hypothetical protein P4O66_019969 [Electrophorus voltai]